MMKIFRSKFSAKILSTVNIRHKNRETLNAILFSLGGPNLICDANICLFCFNSEKSTNEFLLINLTFEFIVCKIWIEKTNLNLKMKWWKCWWQHEMQVVNMRSLQCLLFKHSYEFHDHSLANTEIKWRTFFLCRPRVDKIANYDKIADKDWRILANSDKRSLEMTNIDQKPDEESGLKYFKSRKNCMFF